MKFSKKNQRTAYSGPPGALQAKNKKISSSAGATACDAGFPDRQRRRTGGVAAGRPLPKDRHG